MRIADRLRQEFASGPSFLFPSLSIWNGFKIYRQNSPGLTKVNCFSTKPLLNFVFIRPNNTTPRRCILLTNGAGEDLGSNWGGTLLLAANLVMRLCAVVIYENFVSEQRDCSLYLLQIWKRLEISVWFKYVMPHNRY